MVTKIAADVGMEIGDSLQSEVKDLDRRLEDARETLSTLADTVDSNLLQRELARNNLCQTKNFLGSVQQVRTCSSWSLFFRVRAGPTSTSLIHFTAEYH